MRIRTTGEYAHRDDEIQRVADTLECSKTAAVMESIRLVDELLGARPAKRGVLEEALEHDDMTPELAEVLSNRLVSLEVRRETSLEIGE